MKINYNTEEKKIEIKDGLKTQYLLIKLVLILNLGVAILNLYAVNEWGGMEIFWVVLGISSLLLLYLFIFKKSTANNIPVDSISRLNKKSVLGRNVFSIQLENGKKRDLTEISTQEEFNQLKTLFSNIGISQ